MLLHLMIFPEFFGFFFAESLKPFEPICLAQNPFNPNPYDPSPQNGSVWVYIPHPWIGPSGDFGPEPDRPGPLSTPIYML
jgi:hypothetical protein